MFRLLVFSFFWGASSGGLRLRDAVKIPVMQLPEEGTPPRAPTPEVFYEQHLYGQRPAVLRALASSWLAAEWKDEDRVRELYGEEEFAVELRKEQFGASDEGPPAKQRMRFKHFLDRCASRL